MALFNLPNQRTSIAEKEKESFYRATLDYYINLAETNNDKTVIQDLLNAANGILDEKVFKYVLTPYGDSYTNNLSTFRLPGEIRNVSLITPIIDKVMGEFVKLPHRYNVIVANPDVINKKTSELNKKVKEAVKKIYANKLIQNNIIEGEPQQTDSVKDIANDHTTNWQDDRAIAGQNYMDFLKYDSDDSLLYTQAFYDWIVTNETYSYRTVYNDNVIKEVISPLEYYRISNGSFFIEDDDAGVRKYKLSIHQITDRFRHELSENDIKYLDDLSTKYTQSDGSITVPLSIVKSRISDEYYATFYQNSPTSDYVWVSNNGLFDVNHVVCKTFVKVGILKYIDGLGQENETIVTEDYTLNLEQGDISIDWEWVNQVWEGWRIGDKHVGIYLKLRPVAVQRDEINNISKCKLPYNGIVSVLHKSVIHSIPFRLLGYEAIHKIFTLQLERMVSKEVNSGKVMVIPQSLLGSDEISQSENIYMMTADGKIIVDDSDNNFHNKVSGFKIIDAGMGKYINEIRNLIQQNKTDAWEAVSWNRQRDSQVMASDGKAVTEMAIDRSALGSVLMHETFNKFRERDYEADLDYSKVAWNDGQQGSYITPDGTVAYFAVNGLEHMETQYGIHVASSAIEFDKLKAYRDMAFSAAQNGEFEIAINAIEGTNSAKIKNALLKFMEIKRAYEAKLEADRNETQKYVADKQEQIAREDRDFEKYKVNSINETAIEKALITADIAIIGNPTDNINMENDAYIDDASLVREKMASAERINQRNLDFQREKETNADRRLDKQLKAKKESDKVKAKTSKTKKK